MSTRCFSCGGPYHPDTGDWDDVYEIARCGVCMERFKNWFKDLPNKRVKNDHHRPKGYETFWQAAQTSIKPKT